MYRICIIPLLLLATQNVSAQMYKWVDENGQVQFSDRPQPGHVQQAQKPAKRPTAISEAETKVREIQAEIRAKYQAAPLYQNSIKLDVRQLLLQRNFSKLNAVLDDYLVAFQRDVSKERDLMTAYMAFEINDDALPELLNAWVKESPDAYQPYMARAHYYYRSAWNARGGKWASETKQQQFKKMNDLFTKSANDIQLVLEINDRVLPAYYLLIGMMRSSADINSMTQVFSSALDKYPDSYYLRRIYLGSVTPRWGGSYKLMQAVIDEAQKHVANNPRLTVLGGLPYGEAADTKSINNMYTEADTLYTKVLSYGEDDLAYFDRGKNNFRRENYAQALKDLNQAIALYSEDGDYYYWRSKSYAELGEYHKSLNDIERADLLKPGDDYFTKQRKWLSSKFENIGYEQEKNVNFDDAIDNYTTASSLDPDNAYLYYRRSRSLASKGDMAGAEKDLQKAMELDPDQYDFYAMMDYVLAKKHDWSHIIAYWDKYIERHPNDGRAYVERGGAYYHKGDLKEAVRNAKISADLGNPEGKEAYAKFAPRLKE